MKKKSGNLNSFFAVQSSWLLFGANFDLMLAFDLRIERLDQYSAEEYE